MKLHILSENLQKKVSLLQRGVSSKSQLPVLLNFLILAKNGTLILESTDLEIGIRIEIPANIEEEGGVTVVARKFVDLINSLPAGKITIQTNNSLLDVVSTKTKSSFQTVPKEEFPTLYENIGEEFIKMSLENFVKNITPIVFAASFDTSRPALSGVLVEKAEKGILFVATDGYRLSLRIYDEKIKDTKFIKPLLVPARLFKELSLIKDSQDLKIFLSLETNQIVFNVDSTTLVGRLIEAEYPPYQKIIPASFQTRAIFDREEFEKAIKIASVFARDASNVVRLTFGKAMLQVSANAPSVGENVVEMEAVIEGAENQIAFNAKYLLDLLSAISEERIIIEMVGPLSPGVFKLEKDPSFLHLIMPIRLQS